MRDSPSFFSSRIGFGPVSRVTVDPVWVDCPWQTQTAMSIVAIAPSLRGFIRHLVEVVTVLHSAHSIRRSQLGPESFSTLGPSTNRGCTDVVLADCGGSENWTRIGIDVGHFGGFTCF